MPTRVKICGITRVEDARTAIEHGAHALGLVFYERSPRYVTIAQAKEIRAMLPPFVTTVALFVNPSEEQVNAVVREVRPELLQFHGDEPSQFCRKFNLPYLKAIRVKSGTDFSEYLKDFYDARALLLDAYVEGEYGGTGEIFDWSLVHPDLPLPVVLSGGLTAQNVGQAIRALKPWAVDVSSGVEASKGIKDPQKIAAFIEGVRNADL